MTLDSYPLPAYRLAKGLHNLTPSALSLSSQKFSRHPLNSLQTLEYQMYTLFDASDDDDDPVELDLVDGDPYLLEP